MPKILCLHGQGTSGLIFKSQSASFRAKLPRGYEFDFPDGPFITKPHPGIDVLFSSGTYTWWPEATPNGVRAAHLWLDEYMEANGPYDGVCCFSQGCSLIGTYLLYHAKENPAAPLPFKSAMFICGGLPLVVLEDLGLEVSQRAHEHNERTVQLMKAKSAMLYNIDKLPKGQGLWDNISDLEHDAEEMPEENDVFGLDFTEFPENVRIKIPTVHIYGAKDPRWSAGVQLAYFCDDRTLFDHGGGHDIPRTTPVSVKIAGLLESLNGN